MKTPFSLFNARFNASSMLESRANTAVIWYALPLLVILALLAFAPNTMTTLVYTLVAVAVLATAPGWDFLSRRLVAYLRRRAA